jgi:hypothetical protein
MLRHSSLLQPAALAAGPGPQEGTSPTPTSLARRESSSFIAVCAQEESSWRAEGTEWDCSGLMDSGAAAAAAASGGGGTGAGDAGASGEPQTGDAAEELAAWLSGARMARLPLPARLLACAPQGLHQEIVILMLRQRHYVGAKQVGILFQLQLAGPSWVG